MANVKVNAVGDQCPIPVVKATKALGEFKEAGTLEVQVDNEIAIQNLTRLADSKGLKSRSEKLGDNLFAITMEVNGPLTMGGEDLSCHTDNRGDFVVAIDTDARGRGSDDLGRTLMKGFIYAVSQLEILPKTILFYNVQDLITLRSFAQESGQREINIEKLNRMQEYAEAQVCRRRILLNYFGETSECSCGNCDVCKNPPQHFDGSILVQKALSAIKRCNEEIGFTIAVDVLKGNFSPAVITKGYDKIKTFASGRDVPANDWRTYLLQMLQMGYIEIAYNEDNHLKVTPLGEDILYGRKQAQLSVIVREDLRVTKRKRKHIMEEQIAGTAPDEELLFEKLRALRKTIAEEIGKPAYIVFSDKSLHALASEKPTDLFLFGNTYGIGEHKKTQFGERFVDLICNHLGVNRSPEPVSSIQNQAMDEDTATMSYINPELSYMDRQKLLYSKAYAPWTEEEEKDLLLYYQQGKTIAELVEIFQRNAGAIRSRLRKLDCIMPKIRNK